MSNESIDLNSWFADHAHSIEAQLLQQLPLVYPVELPPNLLLSDLRLCGAVPSIEPPPGYANVFCHVLEHGIPLLVEHNVHVSDARDIIEYTPGEFVGDERAGVSGKPLLLEKAPDLIQTLTNEVFVIHAPQAVIEHLLDIKYIFD